MTRRYGIIAIDREAGPKALRNLVAQGRKAVASGRGIIIYPEGTRVRVGETPPLKSGFAALYRAVGLPVVPVRLRSRRSFEEELQSDAGGYPLAGDRLDGTDPGPGAEEDHPG